MYDDFTPTPGRIVEYTLNKQDVEAINKRRSDAKTHFAAQQDSGFVVHFGNDVVEGDKFPMLIVRVWNSNSVNGQVFLDGNDTLWALSVSQGDEPRTFRPFPRV